MKIPLFLPLLAISLTSLSLSARDPVMGMPPGKLLNLLPPAPEGWKLISSSGINEISPDSVLMSFATREYRMDLPPLENGTLPPPKICKLTLMDSAFDPERTRIYRHFDAPKGPERIPLKRYPVGGVPVIEQRDTTGAFNLRLAFAERLHLTLFAENTDEKEIKQWLGWIRPQVIEQAARDAPKRPPTPKFYEFHYVNELDPSKNRVSLVAYQTKEEQEEDVEQVQREIDALPRLNRNMDGSPISGNSPTD